MTVRAKLTDRQLQITVRISAAVLDMSEYIIVKMQGNDCHQFFSEFCAVSCPFLYLSQHQSLGSNFI